MYLKINGELQEVMIETVSEGELIAYFEELCQSAKANPWRWNEFRKAERVLKELSGSTEYVGLKEKFLELETYRKKHITNPANKRKPTNYVEAMAMRLKQ